MRHLLNVHDAREQPPWNRDWGMMERDVPTVRPTTKAIVSGVVAGALIAGAILWFNVPFDDSRAPPAKEAAIEPTTKPADGVLYARIGVDAQKTGDFDQAIKLYSQAIESGDLPREDLARVYNNRGAAFKNTDFYDLAIEDYNAAIRLKKDYARAYFNRATAYHGKGRPKLAIKDYDSAIRSKPDYASAYNNRAIAHEKIGQYDLAVDDFSQAIRLVPGLDYAYFNRGRVYQIKGDLEHAIEDFKKSYSLNPDNRDYQAKIEELGLLEKTPQEVRTASSPDKMAPATEPAPAEPSEALTTTPPERALPPATNDTGTKPPEASTAASSDGASPPSTDQTDTQRSRLSTPDPSKDATTRSGMETLTEGDGNLVFPIQSRLKEKSLDPGPLDGLMGPRTRAAIKAHALLDDARSRLASANHNHEKPQGAYDHARAIAKADAALEYARAADILHLKMMQKAPSNSDSGLTASSPKQQATAEPTQTSRDSTIAVLNLVLARDVVDRKPVGKTAEFSSGDAQAFAFARLRNDGPPERVSFVWYQADAVISKFEVKVGTSAGWRTWSKVNIRPGRWRVELVTEGGQVLGDAEFSVQ